MYSKQYMESIKKCYELLELLANETQEKTMDEWFCNHMLSYDYYLQGDYELSIEYGKYAAIIIKNYDDTNYNRTVWLIGNCYREEGNNNEAIRMYKICSNYYRNIKSNRLRLSCLFNISKLIKSVDTMERIIKLYSQEVDKIDKTIHNQMDYEKSVLSEMYIDTVNMYIADNKMDKAFRVINTIQDKHLRKQLGKKLMAA